MTGRVRVLLLALPLLAIVALVGGYFEFGWLFYRYQSSDCKQRGKAYQDRVEKLRSAAHDRLRIGTHREDVVRFFQENGLPVSFNKSPDAYEFAGTIYTQGCAGAGCGSDDALLGLRVKVDANGTVIGEPDVGALYTNCL
jgi:hypothetical protein